MEQLMVNTSVLSLLRDYIALTASTCRDCRVKSENPVSCLASWLSGIRYTFTDTVVHSGSKIKHI